MEIVVSGIRSTGCLHLGNYFGAVINFLKLQNDPNYKCYFFIADLHSLTTHPSPIDFRRNTRDVLIDYLGCGLDPNKVVLYAQSDIPEITELYLLLNMVAYKGELEKVATFKDKIRKQQENINAGLLTYPVLMAADILIHKANKVPVGKDQIQHLELCRNFGNRFNFIYKTIVFPEPHPFNFDGKPITVPGFDGKGKMGKSDGNGIYLRDSDTDILKKLKKAVSGLTPTIPNAPMDESIANLFIWLNLVSSVEVINYYLEQYNNCTIRFGDLKHQLAEDIIKFISPIRSNIQSIQQDIEYQNEILQSGAKQARANAQKTLKEVREIIGID
jgi:tryptophanyl-tRNA synthetase